MRWGVLLRWVPTCTTRLYFRAAATMASPSSTSTLIGFCYVHMRACFHGFDGLQGMPVVRAANQHYVELVLGQHLAVDHDAGVLRPP